MAYANAPVICDGVGMTLFAARVDAWLEHREWSRYKLATAMGGPGAEDQLRKWMRGDHEPSGRSVRRVASALGVTDAEFWAGPPATAPDAESLAEDLNHRIDAAGTIPPPPTPGRGAGERRRTQGRRASDQHPS